MDIQIQSGETHEPDFTRNIFTNEQNQILIYKRMLFEIKILRQSIQDTIVNELKNICDAKKTIKQTQETLYNISNNLHSK
jgi:argininosuccinate lyase